MAKKSGTKPTIAGGRTLAKMRRGSKSDGGGKRHGTRKVWFELSTVERDERARKLAEAQR